MEEWIKSGKDISNHDVILMRTEPCMVESCWIPNRNGYYQYGDCWNIGMKCIECVEEGVGMGEISSDAHTCLRSLEDMLLVTEHTLSYQCQLS